MSGLIRTPQVLSQFGLIWREFGPRCAVRCAGAILHRRPTTFLDLAFDTAGRGKKSGWSSTSVGSCPDPAVTLAEARRIFRGQRRRRPT
jgi:hypothetical protein